MLGYNLSFACLGGSAHTFSTDGPEGMDVVLVDKLFLQDHLHGNDDLSQDDQQVSCRRNQKTTGC